MVYLTLSANQTIVPESSGKVEVCVMVDRYFEIPSFYFTLRTVDGTALGEGLFNEHLKLKQFYITRFW